MGAKIHVQSGDRYGNLTIISEVFEDHRTSRRFLCQCDCGNQIIVKLKYLRNGDTKSCGCMKHHVFDELNYKHGFSKRGERSRLYEIWISMKKRCHNPNTQYYDRYGGRGISVCPEWNNSFQSFYEWAISNGYSDELTIDRIDNDGNYTPENCRWTTRKIQSNNKSNNVIIVYNGEKHTASEWSKLIGVSENCIIQRMSRGKRVSPEEILYSGKLPRKIKH